MAAQARNLAAAAKAVAIVIWSWLGIACALTAGLLAFVRSRAPGGFYDTDVYAMTPRTHRTYAAIFAGLAAFFCGTLVLHSQDAATIGFAALVLIGVFYVTSFLRGFSDDQN